MRRLLVVLVLVSVAFAQPSGKLSAALTDLCQTSQTFVGGAVMLLFLLAFVVLAAGLVLYKFVKTENKTIRFAGLLLLALGALALLGAVLGMVMYWLTPHAIQALLAVDGRQIDCNPSYPPYCGQEYCQANGYADAANCTCIMH